MSSKLSDRAFGVSILMLVAFQAMYLDLGHFWDESWVYAPAIRTMAAGTPSILPDALSVELSRGHPLLFQFLGGIWMKLFGASNISAHTYALAISVSLLIILYSLAKKLFGASVALTTALIVMAQPMFMTQSAMLYPEMLMALGLIVALSGYLQNKTWLYYIGMFIAIYSKESALVFFVAFLGWDVVRVLTRESASKTLVKHAWPALFFLSHLLLQYLYHGWFLFPEHTDLVTLEMKDVRFNVRKIYRILFEGQYRGWMLYPVLVGGAFLFKLKKWWINLLVVLIGFSAYKVLIWKWVVPTWLFPIILLAAVFIPIALWLRFRERRSFGIIANTIGLGFIVTIGFVIFSAMNFFTPRYLLASLILISLLTAIIIWSQRFMPTWSKYLVSVFCIGLSLFATYDLRTIGDTDLGVHDDLKNQKISIAWITENIDRDADVCTDFVMSNYLINEYGGHVGDSNFMRRWFPDICKDCKNVDYIIKSPTAVCNGTDSGVLSGFELVFENTMGPSTVQVYRRAESR